MEEQLLDLGRFEIRIDQCPWVSLLHFLFITNEDSIIHVLGGHLDVAVHPAQVLEFGWDVLGKLPHHPFGHN